jgi:ABC-type phosphate/phosphonate transport system substrate-binding protein
MYDVTPAVRAHWHALIEIAARNAAVPIECIDHAAPLPLTELWAREDLAAAFMCGYPLATRYPNVRPLAAPVTVLAEDDRPSYRSLWLVRGDSAFDSLASTFGHRLGWLAKHSHSGFNAPRHALLAHRTASRPTLYCQSIGPLGHPRGALAALTEARIDVTAVDGYWWWLLQRHHAATAGAFRAIGATPAAPMPPLVCSSRLPAAAAQHLAAALLGLHEDSQATSHLVALGIRRFAVAAREDYALLADLDRAARAAGYPLPA